MYLFRIVGCWILILGASPVFTQQVCLNFETGFGAYQMEELKELGETVTGQLPLDIENLADYPPYLYYQPSFSLNWDKFAIGLLWSMCSTGSRYSLKDFTGEYLFDTRLKAHSYALNLQLPINPEDRIQVSVYAELGYIRTKWSYKESLYVDQEMLFDEQDVFYSDNYYTEPGLKISYAFTWVSFFMNTGYSLQFGKGNFWVEEYGQKYEIFYYQEKIAPGWDGYRLGLGININLAEILKM